MNQEAPLSAPPPEKQTQPIDRSVNESSPLECHQPPSSPVTGSRTTAAAGVVALTTRGDDDEQDNPSSLYLSSNQEEPATTTTVSSPSTERIQQRGPATNNNNSSGDAHDDDDMSIPENKNKTILVGDLRNSQVVATRDSYGSTAAVSGTVIVETDSTPQSSLVPPSAVSSDPIRGELSTDIISCGTGGKHSSSSGSKGNSNTPVASSIVFSSSSRPTVESLGSRRDDADDDDDANGPSAAGGAGRNGDHLSAGGGCRGGTSLLASHSRHALTGQFKDNAMEQAYTEFVGDTLLSSVFEGLFAALVEIVLLLLVPATSGWSGMVRILNFLVKVGLVVALVVNHSVIFGSSSDDSGATVNMMGRPPSPKQQSKQQQYLLSKSKQRRRSWWHTTILSLPLLYSLYWLCTFEHEVDDAARYLEEHPDASPDEVRQHSLSFVYVYHMYILIAVLYRLAAFRVLVHAFVGFACTYLSLLFVSDTPPDTMHQIIARAVFDAIIIGCSLLVASANERYSRESFLIYNSILTAKKELRRANRGIANLISAMLPDVVIERLSGGESTICDRAAEGSVSFSTIHGFSEWCAKLHRTSSDVVGVITKLTTAFDQAAIQCGVQKVKTIGDKYWAVCGLPQARVDSAYRLCKFNLRQLEIVDMFNRHFPEFINAGEEKLHLRVGCHTGPLVGGVLGTKQISYEVFGETNDAAEWLEQNAEPDTIIVSAQTKEAVEWFLRPRPPRVPHRPGVSASSSSTSPGSSNTSTVAYHQQHHYQQQNMYHVPPAPATSGSNSTSHPHHSAAGGVVVNPLVGLGHPAQQSGSGSNMLAVAGGVTSATISGASGSGNGAQNANITVRTPFTVAATPAAASGSSSTFSRTPNLPRTIEFTTKTVSSTAKNKDGSLKTVEVFTIQWSSTSASGVNGAEFDAQQVLQDITKAAQQQITSDSSNPLDDDEVHAAAIVGEEPDEEEVCAPNSRGSYRGDDDGVSAQEEEEPPSSSSRSNASTTGTGTGTASQSGASSAARAQPMALETIIPSLGGIGALSHTPPQQPPPPSKGSVANTPRTGRSSSVAVEDLRIFDLDNADEGYDGEDDDENYDENKNMNDSNGSSRVALDHPNRNPTLTHATGSHGSSSAGVSTLGSTTSVPIRPAKPRLEPGKCNRVLQNLGFTLAREHNIMSAATEVSVDPSRVRQIRTNVTEASYSGASRARSVAETARGGGGGGGAGEGQQRLNKSTKRFFDKLRYNLGIPKENDEDDEHRLQKTLEKVQNMSFFKLGDLVKDDEDEEEIQHERELKRKWQKARQEQKKKQQQALPATGVAATEMSSYTSSAHVQNDNEGIGGDGDARRNDLPTPVALTVEDLSHVDHQNHQQHGEQQNASFDAEEQAANSDDGHHRHQAVDASSASMPSSLLSINDNKMAMTKQQHRHTNIDKAELRFMAVLALCGFVIAETIGVVIELASISSASSSSNNSKDKTMMANDIHDCWNDATASLVLLSVSLLMCSSAAALSWYVWKATSKSLPSYTTSSSSKQEMQNTIFCFLMWVGQVTLHVAILLLPHRVVMDGPSQKPTAGLSLMPTSIVPMVFLTETAQWVAAPSEVSLMVHVGKAAVAGAFGLLIFEDNGSAVTTSSERVVLYLALLVGVATLHRFVRRPLDVQRYFYAVLSQRVAVEAEQQQRLHEAVLVSSVPSKDMLEAVQYMMAAHSTNDPPHANTSTQPQTQQQQLSGSLAGRSGATSLALGGANSSISTTSLSLHNRSQLLQQQGSAAAQEQTPQLLGAVNFALANVTVCYCRIRSNVESEATNTSDVWQGMHNAYLNVERVLEKYPSVSLVKTMGNTIVVAGSLNITGGSSNEYSQIAAAHQVVQFAVEVVKPPSLPTAEAELIQQCTIRCGVHTGPLNTGIFATASASSTSLSTTISSKRFFSFDIFGDAVNTASRCSSAAREGTVQITSNTVSLCGRSPRHDIAHLGVLEDKCIKGLNDGAPVSVLVCQQQKWYTE